MRAGYISEMFPRRAIGVGGRPLATLRPAKGYNEVGGVAEEEADKQAPHDDLRRPKTFCDAEKFGYDVDDGPRG